MCIETGSSYHTLISFFCDRCILVYVELKLLYSRLAKSYQIFTSPNFSRLTESWKQEGWEYRFYNDDDARNFLQTHFPIEVLEAFDILIPGAFKADLFRYCVLFIHGGIYADADVLLTANLESAIDNDVGFMTPFDSMSP